MHETDVPIYYHPKEEAEKSYNDHQKIFDFNIHMKHHIYDVYKEKMKQSICAHHIKGNNVKK
jgi:hypothetical protein